MREKKRANYLNELGRSIPIWTTVTLSLLSWHIPSAIHMEDGSSRGTVCIHRSAHVILECGTVYYDYGR